MAEKLIVEKIGNTEQHVYHHYDATGVTVNVKVEKNSKGYNWEVTVIGAKSPGAALDLIEQAEQELLEVYGDGKA